ERGAPRLDAPVELWITTRMTHVFALGTMRGIPGAGALADHGIAALRVPLHDEDYGGWFASATPEGRPVDAGKAGYAHAFVVLAAASATAAGRPGAATLLADALEVMERRFWREDEGRCLEQWDREWREPEPYRGANSNMHIVECFLAAADATGEPVWRERALRIAEHLIHGAARTNRWRLPEHFDESWQVVWDYNTDQRGHAFRPYGSTVGHWLEWSRLLLHLDAALPAGPAWLVEDARALFDTAVEVGWGADGCPGFVYTVDWEDQPVVRERMHWVLAEGIAAAAALARRTGEERYERWYRTWWDSAEARFLDRRHGSWHHELDPSGRPSATVWSGKPDVYHAYQATLLPQLPLERSLAAALRDQAAR
ncbi:MAG: AGE family epimerase/isomerase, partial [Actinomycetota bacterium]|nr:AGE family epimerase/isomerase [Actinomycetota bacterium]